MTPLLTNSLDAISSIPPVVRTTFAPAFISILHFLLVISPSSFLMASNFFGSSTRTCTPRASLALRRSKSSSAILAFWIFAGICGETFTQFRENPFTNSLFRALFPWAFRMVIAPTGYLALPLKSSVLTLLTASTAILEKKSASLPIILEDILVFAAFIMASSPRSESRIDMFLLMNRHASFLASRKPDMMVVGWMCFLTSSFADFKSSAARITTLVVPSPTSWSCMLESSTKTFPAGCSTSS
mmetsp:Transcript_32780/g.52769  ORF Transcript_32780/g.52769 Transcript_32780/m.52769 type:complete len:243 (-) Transcript_32780:239-967(-)